MKFLLIKHAINEGLGIFAQFCQDANIVVETVELGLGEDLPSSLADYSALIVMGGAMNVGDTTDFPWLVAEKQLIRRAVQDEQLPYLGTCLGAQLLADALGGEVGPMSKPEMGVLPITLNQIGQTHPLLAGLATTHGVVQWHGQEVKRLPEGTTVLAASAQCQVQAFAVGERAFGLQFHSEVTATSLRAWLQVPAYCADLEKHLGPQGCADFQQAVLANLSEINQQAEVVFGNFIGLVQNARKAAAVA